MKIQDGVSVGDGLIDLCVTTGHATFVLNSTETSPYHVKGRMYEIHTWGMDNVPMEMEPVLDFYIKWDGCSHIDFLDENGEDDSYRHICGGFGWRGLCRAMEALFKWAMSNIKEADDEWPPEVDVIKEAGQ